MGPHSYIMTEEVHSELQRGTLVERVIGTPETDYDVVLGMGFDSVSIITEHGVVFSIKGTTKKIFSIMEPLYGNSSKVESPQIIKEAVRGEAGPPGKSGAPGVPGPQGPQGEIGPQGIRGDRGERGFTGESGSSGIGVKFVDNLDETTMLIHLTDGTVFSVDLPKGPAGFNGVQGIQGEPGITGAVGDRGEKGERGEQGLPGKDGRDGVPGKQGKQGIPGIPGERGEQGKDGKQGERGPAGKKGDRGQQGPIGLQGPEGPIGQQGQRGKQGPKGKDGKDGKDGKAGDSGVVRARFPLKYDDDKQELTFDAKSLEKVLSVSNFDPMAINNLLTSIGGGGAVGIRHDGVYLTKSVSDIYVNRGLDATRRGKDVNLQLDVDVPFSFSGTSMDGQKNEDELGTGDFWFNTTVGKLFFRIDDSWVEV